MDSRQCARTRGGAAVGVSHREGDPAGDPLFDTQALAEPVGKPEDGPVLLRRVEAVPLQDEVGGHVRRRFRRGDRAGIGPAGALGQQPGGTRPEKALRGPGGQVDDPADDVQPVPAERFRRGVADPGQRGDRPRIQPVGRLSEGNPGGVPRCRRVGRHRRQHAVAREPGTAVDAVQHLQPHLRQLHDVIGRQVEVPERRRQIELDGIGRNSLDMERDTRHQFDDIRYVHQTCVRLL